MTAGEWLIDQMLKKNCFVILNETKKPDVSEVLLCVMDCIPLHLWAVITFRVQIPSNNLCYLLGTHLNKFAIIGKAAI